MQRVAFATEVFERTGFQKPPFFCGDKTILNVELSRIAFLRADSFKDEFDVWVSHRVHCAVQCQHLSSARSRGLSRPMKPRSSPDQGFGLSFPGG
jgi:hypothetical protein